MASHTFPLKSKFAPGRTYEGLILDTYGKAGRVVRQRDRWVYDWNAGDRVGREGETALRLVTERDGEVVTFYPIGGSDVGNEK